MKNVRLILNKRITTVINSKICIGIQSQLILPEFIYLMLFEKSNLRVQRKNTLNLECKGVRQSVFRKAQFFHTFSVNLILLIYRKCMGFQKNDHGLLCTPDLVYCFFEFVSYYFQRESIKCMNSGRNSRP